MAVTVGFDLETQSRTQTIFELRSVKPVFGELKSWNLHRQWDLASFGPLGRMRVSSMDVYHGAEGRLLLLGCCGNPTRPGLPSPRWIDGCPAMHDRRFTKQRPSYHCFSSRTKSWCPKGHAIGILLVWNCFTDQFWGM